MNPSESTNFIEKDCPICNTIHHLELNTRKAKVMIKGETIDFEEQYLVCHNTSSVDNEFITAKLMDSNLLKARDAYRQAHNLLTSSAIADIRKNYGLSQSDFSLLLGWGEVTVTRYETKTIQDATYDRMMRMVQSNPLLALNLLEQHQQEFDTQKYTKIRKIIVRYISEYGVTYLKQQAVISQYVDYQIPSTFNGQRLLDLERIASVIDFLTKYLKRLNQLTLMKLLWYCDVEAYQQLGHALTGLVYHQTAWGIFPLAGDDITSITTKLTVEETKNHDYEFYLKSNRQVELTDFTPQELTILKLIVSQFDDFNSNKILKTIKALEAKLPDNYDVFSFEATKIP